MSHQHQSRNDLEALFPERVLTVPDVAERLRRHPMTVVRAITREQLEAITGLGRPYLMTRVRRDRAPGRPRAPAMASLCRSTTTGSEYSTASSEVRTTLSCGSAHTSSGQEPSAPLLARVCVPAH